MYFKCSWPDLLNERLLSTCWRCTALDPIFVTNCSWARVEDALLLTSSSSCAALDHACRMHCSWTQPLDEVLLSMRWRYTAQRALTGTHSDKLIGVIIAIRCACSAACVYPPKDRRMMIQRRLIAWQRKMGNSNYLGMATKAPHVLQKRIGPAKSESEE